MTKNPQAWNRSSPNNPPTGYTMLSSHGGWDTGAKKRGASPTTQSRVKDKDPKAKSMVSKKPFSPHRFSGIMFWMEKYEGRPEHAHDTDRPDTATLPTRPGHTTTGWWQDRRPVVSKRPLHRLAAAKMSPHIHIGPEPVLAAHARSPAGQRAAAVRPERIQPRIRNRIFSTGCYSQ